MGRVTARRLPGWRKNYEGFVDQVKAQPFAWGGFDCAIGFAGGLVLALTGVDPAAAYRGRYSTRLGALRVMRRAGFRNLGEMVSSILVEHDHPSQMRLGDIVAVPSPDAFGCSLGLCNGGGVIFVLREDGLGVLEQTDASRAWRIGDA